MPKIAVVERRKACVSVVSSQRGNGRAPQTLLVCPAPIAEVDQFDDEFEGGTEKSRQLASHFAAIAEARSCPFLDAGVLISSSDVDESWEDHLDIVEHDDRDCVQ